MYFYLSLGTNINPRINAVKMVEALSTQYGPVLLFPFVDSKPVGIDTPHRFLNSIAVIESRLAPTELKAQLNSIEERLGRDRSDPLKSVKDRTADIDILTHHETFDLSLFKGFDTPYIHECMEADAPKVDLSDEGLLPIQRPTTVNTHGSTSHIGIIEDRKNCFIDRLKSSLAL